MGTITGKSIQAILCHWAIPCTFVEQRTAPQLERYKFELLDFLQLGRLKRLLPNLSMWAGQQFDLDTNVGAGQFELFTTRTPRPILPLFTNKILTDLHNATPLSALLGVDGSGRTRTMELGKMPHLIVGGQTGAGKSVFLNDLILSLAMTNDTTQLGFILIDPKRVEFSKFDGLPHLLKRVLTEYDEIERTFSWLIDEMERRYAIMQRDKVDTPTGLFKQIVVVVDELADLMLANENIKPMLIRLTQKARGCGITCILATQSIRAKVLDGNILANCPTRVALTCASYRESVLILGKKGAENLQGSGDALLQLPTEIAPIRVQIPLITANEIKTLLKEI